MHRDFADWYRIADIEPKGETLEKRWQAIEEFIKSLDATSVLELVRLFHNRPARDSRFIENYRAAFKGTDSTFPMRDNDLELRVLAGSTIVCLLEMGSSDFADVAALGLVCSDYRGLYTNTPLPEIVTRAREHLFSRSTHLRARDEVPAVNFTDLNNDENLVQSVRQACVSGSLPDLGDLLPALFKDLVFAINQRTASIENVMSRLSERQRLLQEESNILWWVFGEYSRDLKQPMVALGLPTTCLIGAKELADLTTVLPGPLAASAFLDKMIRAATRKLPSSTTL